MNVHLVELVRLLAEIAVADYQKELWNKEYMLQQGKGGTVGSEERGSTEENAGLGNGTYRRDADTGS